MVKLGRTYDIRPNIKAETTTVIPFNRFVIFGTTMTQAKLCGAGGKAMGATEYDLRMYNPDNSTRTGYLNEEIIRIRNFGIAIVEAGDAVTAGAYVKSDSTGRAITYTKPTINATTYTNTEIEAVRDMSEICLGTALTSATEAGELIEVELVNRP
jgi:hypothetical protein